MSQRTFWDEPRASVFQCSECSERVANPEEVDFEALCRNCGAALHTCRNCTYFDPAAENECRADVAVRVAKKRANNACASWKAAKIVDLMGSSGKGAPPDPADEARRALDDLFK